MGGVGLERAGCGAGSGLAGVVDGLPSPRLRSGLFGVGWVGGACFL